MLPGVQDGVDLGQGLGGGPPARPACCLWWWAGGAAVAQAPLAVPQLCAALVHEQVTQVPVGLRTTTRLRAALAVAIEDGRDHSEVTVDEWTGSRHRAKGGRDGIVELDSSCYLGV